MGRFEELGAKLRSRTATDAEMEEWLGIREARQTCRCGHEVLDHDTGVDPIREDAPFGCLHCPCLTLVLDATAQAPLHGSSVAAEGDHEGKDAGPGPTGGTT